MRMEMSEYDLHCAKVCVSFARTDGRCVEGRDDIQLS